MNSCSEGWPYQMVAFCLASILSCSPRREEAGWRWRLRWPFQRRGVNRKPIKKPSKKSKGKPGRKPKVRAVSYICCSGTMFVCENTKNVSFMQKSTENDKETDANTTVEDGPGEGFTILSAKSLFLGQKVEIAVLITHYQEFLIFQLILTLRVQIITFIYLRMQGTLNNLPTYIFHFSFLQSCVKQMNSWIRFLIHCDWHSEQNHWNMEFVVDMNLLMADAIILDSRGVVGKYKADIYDNKMLILHSID